MPEAVLQFAQQGVQALSARLNEAQQSRIAGIGVAMPFELWNWAEKIDAPVSDMQGWQTVDFARRLEAECQYPVFVQNDATSACGAELIFGRGSELTDFIYLFIGTFIGGGIVLNHAVYSGRTGNAGALGPLPVMHTNGSTVPLIDHASLIVLENQLKRDKVDFSGVEFKLDQWDVLGESLESWIQETARYLAIAVVAACSVIDFEAAIIDGASPLQVFFMCRAWSFSPAQYFLRPSPAECPSQLAACNSPDAAYPAPRSPDRYPVHNPDAVAPQIPATTPSTN